MLKEGQRVAYVGEPRGTLRWGDTGKVLAMATDDCAHVQWATGAAKGEVTLEFDYDLDGPNPRTKHARQEIDLLADSLDVGTLFSTGLRDTYTTEGPVGLLNAMADDGHLAAFQDIAEEAMSLIAARIRQDPSFRSVIAELDPEESEHLVRLASVTLIRDTFGSEE